MHDVLKTVLTIAVYETIFKCIIITNLQYVLLAIIQVIHFFRDNILIKEIEN